MPSLVSTAESLVTVRKNSLGSDYIAFQADEATVLTLSKSNLDHFFQRVILDPVRGLIMLMSPSRAHEVLSGRLDTVVEEMADELNMASTPMRSTRWRSPGEPENTGVEADCCFYLGENATTYLQAEAQGDAAADAYALAHPPDLVVEVGVTHVDKKKQDYYRRIGVPEHWQVNYDSNASAPPVTVTFMALQPNEDPRPLSVSAILPDMQPADVGEAVEALRDPRFNTLKKRREAIREIIRSRLNVLNAVVAPAP